MINAFEQQLTTDNQRYQEQHSAANALPKGGYDPSPPGI